TSLGAVNGPSEQIMKDVGGFSANEAWKMRSGPKGRASRDLGAWRPPEVAYTMRHDGYGAEWEVTGTWIRGGGQEPMTGRRTARRSRRPENRATWASGCPAGVRTSS